MAVPSNEDILNLLDKLEGSIADDLEFRYLDFKPWNNAKDDMRVAVEYAVCFANAEGGVVVFGVADRIVGRSNAIHGAKGYDLDIWRRGIFDSTRPHLDVKVDELAIPEGTGTLLVMRVPEGSGKPYGTVQGLYKQRVGKNCMPMDAAQFRQSQISTGVVDWSGATAGIGLDALDPVEIGRARNILRRFRPQSELVRATDQDLLVGIGAVRKGW